MITEFTDTTEIEACASRHRNPEWPSCQPARTVKSDWLPLIVLPVVSLAIRDRFADWVFMWLLASSIFFGFKWLTWRRRRKASMSTLRSLAYLLFWPGMDDDFLYKSAQPVAPGEWLRVSAKIVVGVGLIVWAATNVGTTPLLAGWIGMVGLATVLHFGVFSLMACAYRAAGIDARPLMCSPLASASLSDFWSRRWNTAFTKLGHDFVLLPLSRRLGGFWAALSVFVVSGLVHDLVISFPARGGYGLPTAYFVLQGTAVLFERSRPGKTLGLGRGWNGRIFTLAVTALPLPLLFHTPFVHHIMLPMLRAVGGFWGAR